METPLEWFTYDRFGMFVHFGLYSAAARHEWVKSYEFIPESDYQRYVDHFDPDRFDAAKIAKTAKQMGAKYVVLTTKHHEGFCLWNSRLTDYSSFKVAGRDLVREFVDAVRAEGLKVGFYYSVIDWHHPDFTIDQNHPRRRDLDAEKLNETRDMGRYREYLHGHVRELLTDYGQVDYVFYDFTYPEAREGWQGKRPEDWDAKTILEMTRTLQPGAVVNDRLGIAGDFVTPEQYQPTEPLRKDGLPVAWEACHTTNGSWGYDRDNLGHKTPDALIRVLIKSVALNGNVILNVGPDGRGRISSADQAIFAEIGEWMEQHSRSIYGAGQAEFAAPKEGVYTQCGNRLYLHLFDWPMGTVHLPNIAEQVEYAQFLHDGSEIRYEVIDPNQQASLVTPSGQAEGTLTLKLPVRRPDVRVPVIELFLREN